MTDITRRSLLRGAAGSVRRLLAAAPAERARRPSRSTASMLTLHHSGRQRHGFCREGRSGHGRSRGDPQIVAEELGLSPARILSSKVTRH